MRNLGLALVLLTGYIAVRSSGENFWYFAKFTRSGDNIQDSFKEATGGAILKSLMSHE